MVKFASSFSLLACCFMIRPNPPSLAPDIIIKSLVLQCSSSIFRLELEIYLDSLDLRDSRDITRGKALLALSLKTLGSIHSEES